MPRRPHWLVVLVCALSGCNRAVPPVAQPKDSDNLSKIYSAFAEHLNKTGKPPAGEDDLRPYLKNAGDVDAILTSPEDGQKYVVSWGVDFRTVPIERMPPPILAHQKNGINGRRWVATVMGVQPMTDGDFAKADFIGGKAK